MNNSTNKYRTQAIDPNILSVLDITAEGKVVSAQDWTDLWSLVFAHINNIDSYCLSIDNLRIEWEKSKDELSRKLTEFETKYAALENSFIHYGDQAPTNEHIKIWVQPVSDVNTQVFSNALEASNRAHSLAKTAFEASETAIERTLACIKATNNANAAAEELGTIKEELAEGGYITGIKENNHGNILGFWVGSQAEYDALPEPPQNSYVIISDDKTLETLMNRINAVEPVYGTYTPELYSTDDNGQRVLIDIDLKDGWCSGSYYKIGKIVFVSMSLKGKIVRLPFPNYNYMSVSLPFPVGKSQRVGGDFLISQIYSLSNTAECAQGRLTEVNGKSVVQLCGPNGAWHLQWQITTDTYWGSYLSFSGFYSVD